MSKHSSSIPDDTYGIAMSPRSVVGVLRAISGSLKLLRRFNLPYPAYYVRAVDNGDDQPSTLAVQVTRSTRFSKTSSAIVYALSQDTHVAFDNPALIVDFGP